MSDVFDDVVSYFDKKSGGHCTVEKEWGFVKMWMKGANQRYLFYCFFTQDFLRFYITDPLVKIPKTKMAHACMLANMININAFTTFIIMDNHPDDGYLATQAFFPLQGCKLSHDAIDIVYCVLVEHADKYYPAFKRLIWGDVSPEEAFDSVQNNDEE